MINKRSWVHRAFMIGFELVADVARANRSRSTTRRHKRRGNRQSHVH